MELAATRRYLGRLTFDGDRGLLVDEKLHFPTGARVCIKQDLLVSGVADRRSPRRQTKVDMTGRVS